MTSLRTKGFGKKTFSKELKKINIKSFSDSKQYTTYGSVGWKSIRFKTIYKTTTHESTLSGLAKN